MLKNLKNLLRPFKYNLYYNLPQVPIVKRYYKKFNKFPNLIKPKSFNEKIIKKMCFDRRPYLTVFADKYKIREYVTDKLGTDKYLSNIIHCISDPNEITAIDLPASFVMKPNHLSGQVRIVKDSTLVTKESLILDSIDWLSRNYYTSYYEWAYKNIRKRYVLFEEYLATEYLTPDDFKFYCFNGVPKIYHIDRSRIEKHQRAFFDMNHNLIQMTCKYDQLKGDFQVPSNFNEMIEICKKLSKRIDFIRVDLYNIKGRIVFGELTSYPSAGLGTYEPKGTDMMLGSLWEK